MACPNPARRIADTAAVATLVAVSFLTPSGQAGAQVATGEAVYTVEAVSILSGGRETGEAYLGNIDLIAELAYPAHGLTFFAYGLGNHGDSPSALVGDFQVVSNIDAPEALRLFEAGVEKDFSGPRLSLLAGLYDLNSEFDVVETGGLFLNSSFGIGPEYSQSGRAGPSIFPVTSLALRGIWRPRGELYLQAAVLDAVPGDPDDPTATAVRLSSEEGAMIAAEAGWYPNSTGNAVADLHPPKRDDVSAQPGPDLQPVDTRIVGRSFAPPDGRGKVALGLWYYTRPFPEILDPADERHVRPGVYALAEGPVRGQAGQPGSVALFGRAGWADPRVHRLSAYTGGGAVYTGLLPGRNADLTGIGVATAWNGGPYLDAAELAALPVTSTETAIELTYRIEAERWALQPDLQWIVNPDMRRDVENAWVLGIRLEAGAGFGSSPR